MDTVHLGYRASIDTIMLDYIPIQLPHYRPGWYPRLSNVHAPTKSKQLDYSSRGASQTRYQLTDIGLSVVSSPVIPKASSVRTRHHPELVVDFNR